MNTADLKRLVSSQAEDEGLFFTAQTAPEAYLQEAMRKLHGAVEALDDWISVDDRLPDEGTDVLITNGVKVMQSTYGTGCFNYDFMDDATHWQLLPEPQITSKER